MTMTDSEAERMGATTRGAATAADDTEVGHRTPETSTIAPAEGINDGSGPESSESDGGDPREPKTMRRSRRISISLRAVAVGGLLAILVAVGAVMTWFYFQERDTVTAMQRRVADDTRAEQIALDYATGAATVNVQDLNTWKSALVHGTTPQLTDKLNKAATQMQQLFVPLQWTSTAQPLIAKVRSDANGAYVVDTFVSVLTKTAQAPDSIQSTATYSITIDSRNNWQISDVGGIAAMVGSK